ncbi:hypothetical protein CYMTET_8716 [Cymbomonas tetramitiformis]|uniref:Uncharacterized protein n=1 Tax=Cymbomonas tetramitiformis TaxID=36881 RepID=A0AAE0LFQ9_9CHLO|nr:hypothetical protein CYMTET_8716 [Cymbomonas tetramitiformis]
MAVARHWAHLGDHYLVWDSDMILLDNLHLFHGAQVVVHPGGFANLPYGRTYRRLFGREWELFEDGSSFVAHHMVVNKAYMCEMIDQLSSDSPSDPNSWIYNIVRNAGYTRAELKLGFSEYATYISWVMQNHPGTQHVVPSKRWEREPRYARSYLELRHEWYGWEPCCPTWWQLWNARWIDRLAYVGYEAGHIPMCKLHDSEHAITYGL